MPKSLLVRTTQVPEKNLLEEATEKSDVGDGDGDGMEEGRGGWWGLGRGVSRR